jgi:hypothetical protein
MRQTPILIADDLLVREEHRNRGVVTQIMQTAFHDLLNSASPFAFNLSGSTLTVLNSLAMGWKSIGPLYSLHRRSHRFLHAIKHRFNRTETSAEPRPDAMARLVQRIGHNGRLRHVRDQKYFAWRFQNPFREYQFLYAGDSELDGYLVLKRSVGCYEPSQQVSIADLEAINATVRSELLAAATAASAFPDLTMWVSPADNQTLEELRDLGFERADASPVGPTFLVRAIRPDLPETEWCVDGLKLLEQRNWDIRMLYSMSG